MAYSNGRIYVDTSQTPNIGVSIDDLKRCFGVVIEKVNGTGGDSDKGVSCDLGVIIGKSVGDTFTDNKGVQWRVKSRKEINMWAKYKPETAVTGLTTFSIKPITTNPDQRKLNGYSIEAKTNQGYGDISRLVSALRNGTANNPFTYKKPYGTSASPYRITDFENYWHNAPCPIRAPYAPTDKLGVTQQGTLQLYYYVDIAGSQYGLGLKDLRFQSDSNQLSEYYFGILIYNNTAYSAATQETKMGTAQQEGLDVTLTGVPQASATYQMVPFFSTLPFASASESGTGTIYPMIWASQEINTAAEAQYILIYTSAFVWDNDMQTLRFKYSVVNRTSGAHTFNTETYGSSTSYIEVGYSGQALYQRWPVQINVSVPAGQEVSNEVVIASNLYAAQADMIRNGDTKVYITAAQFNGQYVYNDIVQIWEHE